MQRIAFALGGLSTVNGSFALAKRLVSEGYGVTYLTPGRQWRAQIERQGFDVHSCALREEPPDIGEPREGALARARRRLLAQHAQIDHLNRQTERWILETRPSLAVIDANSLEPVPPYLRHGVPIVIISCTLSSFVSDRRPPVFSTTVPGAKNALMERTARTAQWRRLVGKQRLAEMKRWIALNPPFTKAVVPTLRQQIVALGGRLERSEYRWRLRVPEIVLAPAALDWPIPIVGRTRYYAGLCVDGERNDGGDDPDLCEGKENIVYFAMGSSGAHYPHLARLQRCVFDAMASLPDHHLIMQVADPEWMRSHVGVRSNVTYVQWAPQIEVLKRARVFISHAGLSSVREALMHETPMVMFPGWHDQYGNAARVAHFGLGLCGDMSTVTVDTLLSMIRRASSDSAIRTALRDMRRTIERADELSATVAGVRRMLARLETPIAIGLG